MRIILESLGISQPQTSGVPSTSTIPSVVDEAAPVVETVHLDHEGGGGINLIYMLSTRRLSTKKLSMKKLSTRKLSMKKLSTRKLSKKKLSMIYLSMIKKECNKNFNH